MSDKNLYQDVKNKICDFIYEGVYQEGGRIPPERLLAEQLGVSRVTLRKSLELLEEEQLIVKEQGSGSRVSFHNYGVDAPLDMAVLIAPAKNPFFSGFLQAFQREAQKAQALVLYVEKPENRGLEDCLYRLYQKGLKHAVIWLEDLSVDMEKLKRLRALGMNLVFFDTDMGLPFGDCVSLDNGRAVHELYERLKGQGAKEVGYVGWDFPKVYSIRRREEAFLECAGKDQVLFRLPWSCHLDCGAYLKRRMEEQREKWPDGILCGDREIGCSMARLLEKERLRFGQEFGPRHLAAVDEFPEAKHLGVTVCRQDLARSAGYILTCLQKQSREKSRWKAGLYEVEGKIV